LIEAVFVGCKFLNCQFTDCDLRLAKLVGSTFSATTFEKSNLTGIDWTLSAWSKVGLFTPVNFNECDISLCSFFGLDLSKSRIVKCTARETVFAEANLTRAVLFGTDFSDSRFLHTDLTEADFTGATNYAIAPDANRLKGTRFALPEAIRLLSGLDIVITNPSWPS
jgi:fluoroquinolone resistance protein